MGPISGGGMVAASAYAAWRQIWSFSRSRTRCSCSSAANGKCLGKCEPVILKNAWQAFNGASRHAGLAAGNGQDREGVTLGPGAVGVDGETLLPDRDGFVPLGGLGPES